MTWPCFIIEEDEPRVEYLVLHKAGDKTHRDVVYVLPGVEFDDAPEDPPDGYWPDRCPTCRVELSYEPGDWTTGMHSRMGTCSWRNPKTGEIRANQHDWGPGAMYDATEWTPANWRGSDGKCWAVVLPPAGKADFWLIDGEASSGGHWTRTGEAPNLTVTPSILTPNYHGFMTAGALTDSLPDRPL